MPFSVHKSICTLFGQEACRQCLVKVFVISTFTEILQIKQGGLVRRHNWKGFRSKLKLFPNNLNAIGWNSLASRGALWPSPIFWQPLHHNILKGLFWIVLQECFRSGEYVIWLNASAPGDQNRANWKATFPGKNLWRKPNIRYYSNSNRFPAFELYIRTADTWSHPAETFLCVLCSYLAICICNKHTLYFVFVWCLCLWCESHFTRNYPILQICLKYQMEH